MLEAEIRAYYRKLHDDLSHNYYAGTSGLSKEEFDLQHGDIWNDMKVELVAEGYQVLSEPLPDLFEKIKELIQRIEAIENSLSK